MAILMVILRFLHIGAGVYWAGTMIFAATMLAPSIGDAGPAGGAVMAALMKRGMMTKIPAAAIVTILAGFGLYWNTSNHFDSQFMGSPFGITLGLGAVAALIAFGFGMGVVRPNQMKIMATMPGVNALPDGAEKQAKMAEVQAMRATAMKGGRIVSVLLMIAVACMAIARYV